MLESSDIPTWMPGTEDFEAFLEQHIEDAEAGSVKVVEWRPSLLAYGEAARDLFDRCASFLKRAAANSRTAGAFGRRWFKNALRFASAVEETLTLRPGNAPVVVCAAGPSLEAALPALKIGRDDNRCAIVAVSSAASALISGGIIPDLTVATDGGGWAPFHLFEPIRRRARIAAALTAAVPSKAFASPLLPIGDGSRWQNAVCASKRLSPPRAPQRGTVAATALDIARSVTTGPLYLAGFDLGVKHEKTHARPNALDRFSVDGENRLSPSAGAYFARYRTSRDSGTLDIYSSWFRDHIRLLDRKMLLLGSDSPLRGLLETAESVAPVDGVVLPAFLPRTISCKSSAPKGTAVGETAAGLIEAVRGERFPTLTIQTLKQSIAGELIALLFPADYATLLKRLRGGEDARSFLASLREELASCISGDRARYHDE
jgi:hypothetical protein